LAYFIDSPGRFAHFRISSLKRLGNAKIRTMERRPRERHHRAAPSFGGSHPPHPPCYPETQANVVTTEFSDWATNCPEYKVTAAQVMPSNGPTEWQEEYEELTRQSRRVAQTLVAAE
jgi:hypothetical protein